MDEWQARDIVTESRQRQTTTCVTPDGAAWLASASAFPRGVQALWADRPTAPSVLPCGTLFDVVNLPALFGRRVLEELWATGPGSGPVAVHRCRVLLLVAPGTAQRLPALLDWEEWGASVPPMLCHGTGDAVTVPPLCPPEPDLAGEGCTEGAASRWVVAPDSRKPWLPGADHLLWACLRAARAEGRAAACPAARKPVSPLVSAPKGV
ncbi:bifunctional DNA primase/polymerase [Streptomyces polygonati]|uniref:Bifunctional DNA primase/polymerase n=1 Tax=Streptomyces polygonati TaxID=1617087 RepID=A0ABV8HZR6_9ACTN